MSLVAVDISYLHISDKILSDIADHCPTIEYLDLYSTTGYTEIGLKKMMACKHLRKIIFSKKNKIISQFGAHLWMNMRPNLEVVIVSEETPLSDNFVVHFCTNLW